MSSWRDFARKVEPDESEPANSAISANSSEFGGSEAPNGTNGTNGTDLPADIQRGLSRLNTAAAPRFCRADAWPQAVSDTLRLANEGWAQQALNLGWSALDLFGAVTDPAGDPDADGLAVKLRGRKVLAICGSFATVADENGGRSFLYRRTNEGARLLWLLGRGR